MSKLTAPRLACLALACAGFGACADDASTPSSSPMLVGTVIHVYDGDTIKVRLASGPIIVRLHSIDTPEHDQPWGPQAAQALANRVKGRKVSLAVVTHDSYDRLVAEVVVGDESINAWMVQQGNAWAYRHYLEDPGFCALEGEARTSRRGLWSAPPGTWRAPWQWRAVGRGEAMAYTDYSHETVAHCIAEIPTHSRPSNGGAPVSVDTSGAGGSVSGRVRSDGCRIKGNISASGRIYHLPGSDSYAETHIDESKGERWFCTEEEARAAGWRPAGRQ